MHRFFRILPYFLPKDDFIENIGQPFVYSRFHDSETIQEKRYRIKGEYDGEYFCKTVGWQRFGCADCGYDHSGVIERIDIRPFFKKMKQYGTGNLQNYYVYQRKGYRGSSVHIY